MLFANWFLSFIRCLTNSILIFMSREILEDAATSPLRLSTAVVEGRLKHYSECLVRYLSVVVVSDQFGRSP